MNPAAPEGATSQSARPASGGVAAAEVQAGMGLLELVHAAIAIGGSLNPSEVIRHALSYGLQVVSADRATFSTIEGDRLTIQATTAAEQQLTWIGREYPMSVLEAQPVVREALKTGRPVLGGRLEVASAREEFRPALANVRHTAVLPISDAGKVVGLLVLSRRADPPFNAQDLGALALLGDLAGMALRNAVLHVAEQQARSEADAAAERLQLAVTAAEDIARGSSVAEVLHRVLAAASRASGADGGSVAHIVDDEMVIDVSTSGAADGMRWPLSDAARRAVQGGDAVEMAASDYHALTEQQQQIVMPYQRYLLAPLLAAGETVGLLAMARVSTEQFGPERIAAVRQFLPVAALLLRNARLLERAREAENAKGEFMSIAVHEIKSPLTVVIGYASMLREGVYGEQSPAAVDALELVVGKAQEALGLAEELLTVARLEGAGLEVQPELFDAGEVVRRAVDREQARAALAGGAIECAGPAGRVLVNADRELTMRIVAHLFENAITYCDGAPEVSVTWGGAGDAVEIAVSDRGWGVEAVDRVRIFERFVRGSIRRVPRSGSGLGLYVSRRLARVMGGELELRHSEVGCGSTFVLRLPAER